MGDDTNDVSIAKSDLIVNFLDELVNCQPVTQIIIEHMPCSDLLASIIRELETPSDRVYACKKNVIYVDFS